MTMSKPQISEDEYRNASENYEGWCTKCNSFTRDQTEPDAEGYDCPECEENTVVGADNALVMQLFDFK
jgi:Zn finger protein HypA/HybF involved in hydrogenase expression